MKLKIGELIDYGMPILYDGGIALLFYFAFFWYLCWLRADYSSILNGGPTMIVAVSSICGNYSQIRAGHIALAAAACLFAFLNKLRIMNQSKQEVIYVRKRR